MERAGREAVGTTDKGFHHTKSGINVAGLSTDSIPVVHHMTPPTTAWRNNSSTEIHKLKQCCISEQRREAVNL